ncbi:MAG: FAD-binding oxidoreductase [bacterium]
MATPQFKRREKKADLTRVGEAAIRDFRSRFRGEVFRPGDEGYDDARRIWNAMIDRRPGLIARCKGASDVIRAVNFARAHDLLVAVRAGGHNVAGNCTCDGGLVIDLSHMSSVRVDPEAGKAWVGPGATLGDFDRESQTFGLAAPLGINSTTGVAGLTLGGGFGWLSRKHGLTIDHLVGADVVTANGKWVRADEDHNPDLFWALRGGGGNFGVVTNFEFRLHRVGPRILGGLIVYPYAEAKQVLTGHRDLVDSMHEDLNVWTILRKAPPLPFLPAEVHGKDVVVLATFWGGDIDAGVREIEPFRRLGTPVGEHVGPMLYAEWQSAFDALLAPGARNYWKSHNFTSLPDELLDLSIRYAGRLPSPLCEVFTGVLGGEAGRRAPAATAYVGRDARFVMNVHARWETPREDEACVRWAREFFRASAPYATGGVYVNFMTEEEEDRVRAAYGTNYDRLVEIKRKYDPENLFRRNQNIDPS